MSELAVFHEKKVKPECVYFGTCGGCAFQDLEYAAQLELKHKSVEEALSRHCEAAFPAMPKQSKTEIACGAALLRGASSALRPPRNDATAADFKVFPTLPSPKPFHYRHMIALSVRRRQNQLHLCFVGNNRRTYIPIESCPIADERINQFLPEALGKLEALPPERKFHTSQVVLRIGDDGEVVTSLRPDRGRKLECTVGGKHFSYSISSFFQNNFSILESFIETVRSFLEPTNGTLFDLYSGVGFFSILLSDVYERIVGIEEGYEAVALSKTNAERNGVKNVSFLEGKVETLLPELISKAQKPLHVIVDPPRIGLKPEVIKCLNQLPVEKLVYVSCNLEALKRDLELLGARFQIIQVQPLDLFPQTKHVETIVLLQPR